MSKEERRELYEKIYDKFIHLLKGKIDKVVVSQYELYELSKTRYWEDTDGLISYGIVRNTTYADVLKKIFENKNIVQERDLINNNYIYKIEK